MPSRRTFLTTLALGSLAAGLPWFAKGQTATATPVLRAGAGRGRVQLAPSLFPLDGFVGEHDPLFVRVVLLEHGATRYGIVVVDLTSLSDSMVSQMKTSLADIARMPAEHIIVCASHTFSAPHVFPAGHLPPGTDVQRNQAVGLVFEQAFQAAAKQAVDTLQPATMGWGSGTTQVGINRDSSTPHGWWLGANTSGFRDPHVGVLRIDNPQGMPIAVLMNVAVQPSVLDGSVLASGGKLISADLAGAAAQRIESSYGGGTVAMFLVGAAGDQAPVLQAARPVVRDDGSVGRDDLHEAGLPMLDKLGKQLADDINTSLQAVKPLVPDHIALTRHTITVNTLLFTPQNAPRGPVTRYQYQPAGTAGIPVVFMRLGDMVIVGMQSELAAQIGATIRAQSPFAATMVVTMVDGAAKYLPDAPSYDRFTYEARSSPYAQGAAEAVCSHIIAQLQHIHRLKP